MTKKKKYYFIEDDPKDIQLLNRYLIEKNNMMKFINGLAEVYKVSSCIYMPNKSFYLTNIQKIIKEKGIKKEGWVEIPNKKGLLINDITTISSIQLEVAIDYYLDTIYIVSKNRRSLDDLIQLLDRINLFNQPKTLGSFYPTENLINALVDYKVAVIYLKRGFSENNISEERDMFVCYSSWKLED